MILRRRQDPYVLLDAPAVAGRSPDADLVLANARASGRHAELRFRAGRWELRDLASTNGTFRNGLPVPPTTPAPIQAGDRIHFGDTEEEWHVVVACAPAVCLFDPATGERRAAQDGHIEELARYDLETDGWVDADDRPLRDGARVGPWVFHLPAAEVLATTQRDPLRLDDCTLVFRTEAGSDHVDLRVESPQATVEFSGRAWAPALLALARVRTGTDDGWLATERVARRAEVGRKVLDVYLARARQALLAAGVIDGARLVEVRANGRRLGVPPSRIRYERG